MNADELRRAVALAVDTLAAADDRDWTATPAAGLDWTCWETVEHMADDLFTYAAQIAPAKPSVRTHVPFGWRRTGAGGLPLTVFVDPADGPSGLLQVLEACGAMQAALVETVPPDRMSFHNFGASDPSGFAAMGVVEVLVHMHDVASGLGLIWEPPAGLCARALDRLFPAAPAGSDPWPTLLYCTGRADLGSLRAPESWQWDGSPR
ncbi:hypothetical protein ACQP2F_06335 [Actinoplanes sp. CA-030573]|uniref:hypothetical protein n=1 Tax=Actinoplanes sp. CA-030573 TaxID=3239898 RepID=UPI003D8BDF19